MARRRSGTSISATRPVFPNYLLSSLGFVLHRRKSPAAVASPPSDDASAHRPGASPQAVPARLRVSRIAPDTMRCRYCSTDVALTAQIISKGFTGRHGRAFLVEPPSPAAQSLLNVRVGRSEDRQLVTGWHVVADISCATCSWKLGWKYVNAKEPSQKYKVGKYILETERIVTHRSWEDVDVEDLGLLDDDEAGCRGGGGSSDGEIVFDSEDEEECEEVFAGTWDATTVARRRSRAVARGVALVS